MSGEAIGARAPGARDAAGSGDRARVEHEVTAVISGLLAELGSAPGRRIAPGDSLDRDLGLGSLERVELLLRIEQAFGIRLSDAVMLAADTVTDLVTAILAGSPAIESMPQAAAIPGEGAAAPSSARSLIEALAWQVEHNPDRPHILLRGDDGDEQTITYGALWSRAHAVAAGLRARRVAVGESVSLMLRTEEAFFASFFGVLLAGAVPVPIYPPFRLDRLEEYAQRQIGILRNAEATLLVTFDQATRVAGLLRARLASLREVVTAGDLATSADAVVDGYASGGEDAALIQYTSGSTGEPKGVLLSHANLLANIRAIGAALDLRPDDVGVSWLPLYHDMGLIGTWLTALYFGLPIALMSPLAFLARPSRWLWSLHTHRGTVSPAPNFAYELCARRVPDAEIEGLDLRPWRLALNGSEAVSPDTIDRFTRRFTAYGFRAEAMCPVYGLAESSVALTIPPIGRPPLIERISREALQTSRRAVPPAPEEATPLRFVSCGRPIPGHAVRIVDHAERVLGERIEGRIEFRGPSVTAGYYRRPDVNRAVLHDGWMDSGDLGYIADGELFITGRQKDIIIKAGRNLYPEELEEVAGDIAGIRKGCVAAFSVPDPALGSERLVVVAESRATEPRVREALRSAVTDRVVAALGIPPDTVVIAAPRSVRKTSSGKIRRRTTRDAYLQGRLELGRLSLAGQWARLAGRDLGARARRAARHAGDLLFTAWLAAVLLMTLPILWLVVHITAPGPPADRVVKLCCRFLLRACFCPLRVSGTEHLRGLGSVVFCANHSSYLDSVALLAALPVHARFVAKQELLDTPLIRTIIRKVGHLPVERVDLSRSLDDARAVVGALREGANLVVFPEGTFASTPGLLPFRLGAFKAAGELRKPIVPVAIAGTRAILGAGRLPHPGRISVTIAPPILPRGDGWPELVRLRDGARAQIASLTGERLVRRGSRPQLQPASAAAKL
jgi:1-acyl-sn-glycerol-3-phosphate acyltransferase